MVVAKTVEAVARRRYGKLIAFLAAALADWPQSGIPRAPEAWLLTVARRKLIDSAASARAGRRRRSRCSRTNVYWERNVDTSKRRIFGVTRA